jgi:hypothetical protein
MAKSKSYHIPHQILTALQFIPRPAWLRSLHLQFRRHPISHYVDHHFSQKKKNSIWNVSQVVLETQLEWKGKGACSIKQ